MKFEHNKKYTPTKGTFKGVAFEYVGFCDKPKNPTDENSFNHVFVNGNGLQTVWDCDLYLYCFKEYTPPRPDVEVLGDLIEHMNYHLEDVVNDVNGTPEQGCYSNTTPDKLRGLIKEAEEMKKRMESK